MSCTHQHSHTRLHAPLHFHPLLAGPDFLSSAGINASFPGGKFNGTVLQEDFVEAPSLWRQKCVTLGSYSSRQYRIGFSPFHTIVAVQLLYLFRRLSRGAQARPLLPYHRSLLLLLLSRQWNHYVHRAPPARTVDEAAGIYGPRLRS